MIDPEKKADLRLMLKVLSDYRRRREEAWALYPNIIDYYLVYDHYSIAIQMCEAAIENIIEGIEGDNGLENASEK